MNIIDSFPLNSLSELQYFNLLPLFLITIGAVLAILLGTHKKDGRHRAFFASMGFLIAAIFVEQTSVLGSDVAILGETLVFNMFSKTLSVFILIFSLLATLVTYGHDKKDDLLPEVYGLILFATAGMMLMTLTQHLLFMFIAIEIMSFAVYILVSMRRSSRHSAEAGLKYFILGGLASALYLYGSSLIFGGTGSFDLDKISRLIALRKETSFIFTIGLGLVIVAMLFKVGAVPFHSWVADVYQGASTNITGFMGAAVKFTSFMALAKITYFLITDSFNQGTVWFEYIFWIAAALSMIYGNIVAISQNELKRMLSFSTIAHTGYLLLGLYSILNAAQSGDYLSLENLVIYLFFYAITNLGAFAIISQFEERNQKDLSFDQLAGLGTKHPFLGAMLSLFLLSMAGIPLTSGFIAKYGLLNSVVSTGEIPLVVIAVLSSVVSVFYYLRVIIIMFMKESTTRIASYQRLKGAGLVAFFTAWATLQFGLFPSALISFVKLISR